MRMWMVDPARMCRQHLLGEHNECHMLAGCLNRGRRIDGYVSKGLVETSSLLERHTLLALEMCLRGYSHMSPLPPFPDPGRGRIDRDASAAELKRRCPQCRRLLEYEGKL